MTDIPTRRRGLGLTRGRLALLALLVLGSAAGAATYAMRQPAPQASAEWRPPSAVARTPASTDPAASTDPVGPLGGPRVDGSASHLPPTSTGTSPPPQGPHPPDSAVNPYSVFVDPAATATRTPPPTASTPVTCGQWQSLRSDEQRTSDSTALLRAAWENAKSTRVPPASTARSYGSAITAACLGKGKADDSVPDVARALYAADPGKWGP
jgi:hypothetical protein